MVAGVINYMLGTEDYSLFCKDHINVGGKQDNVISLLIFLYNLYPLQKFQHLDSNASSFSW